MSDGNEGDSRRPTRTKPDALSDVAGLSRVKRQLEEATLTPVREEHLSTFGASGILIHGPPGTGKSYLAEALMADLGFERIDVSLAEMPLDDPDEGASYISDIRERALDNAPSTIYIENFDIVAPDDVDRPGRSASRQVVGELCRMLDTLDDEGENVFLIGVTRQLSDVNSRVRRLGRIDLTLGLSRPDTERRREMLRTEIDAAKAQAVEFSDSLDLGPVVDATEGYSAAEVVGVVEMAVREAAVEEPTVYTSDLLSAVESIGDGDGDPHGEPPEGENRDEDIEFGEFVPKAETSADDKTEDTDEEAGGETSSDEDEPSSGEGLGELFGGVDDDALDADGEADDEDTENEAAGSESDPCVTYDDIGGLPEVEQRLREVTVWPRKYPERFEELDIDTAKGIILYGPPGTGKTMLAKAIATETDSTFFSISGPEILDKYVGESEKEVRRLFEDARAAAPTVVFIDELDAVMGSRDGYTTDAPWLGTLVNQFLSELDGLDDIDDVVVVGATNRLEVIDPAIRRPGRLGEAIEVPPPDAAGRREIFRIHTADRTLADDVDIEWLVAHTDDRYTGADIEELCERAAMNAIRDSVDDDPDPEEADKDWPIRHEHFEDALDSLAPTLADSDGDAGDRRGYQ